MRGRWDWGAELIPQWTFASEMRWSEFIGIEGRVGRSWGEDGTAE